MTFLQIFSGASNFVDGVDQSFMVIFGISFFFLIAITAVMIYFVFKYSRKNNPKATQIHGSTTLEIIWTVVPLILVMVMFFYGYKGYALMREVPEDAMPVKVISYMWDFDFEYENGKTSKDLYVPLNKAVKLNLVSLDVIHSFYIPSFRVKEDIVPGVVNYMWFIPQMEGDFDVLCAEYCGLRHSYMAAKVIVMPENKFNTWLADFDPEKDKPSRGLEVLRANACVGCHSLDGSKLVGSTFKGLYGSRKVVIEDGKEKTIKVDAEYISNSIKDPNSQIVKGFPTNLMQSYEKLVSDEDIQEIVNFLKKQE